MARVTDKALIQLEGKVGSLVFRTFNGKKFVSLRPDEYRKSKSTKAIYEKNKFAAAVKFAKCVNSIPLVKQIWNESSQQGFTSYHKILKANLELHKTAGSHKKFSIFPVTESKLINEANLTDKEIFFVLSQPFEHSNKLFLTAVHGSELNGKSKFEFQLIYKNFIDYQTLVNNRISIKTEYFTDVVKEKKQSDIIYLAFASVKENGEVDSYTNTVTITCVD
jgi:hypothetical protein